MTKSRLSEIRSYVASVLLVAIIWTTFLVTPTQADTVYIPQLPTNADIFDDYQTPPPIGSNG